MTSTAASSGAPSVREGMDPVVDAARYSAVPSLMDSLLHDVRNPLNALSIHLEVLTEKLKGEAGQVPASQEKNLRSMREQIQRVDGILRRFSEFIVSRPGSQGDVELSETVTRALDVLSHESRKRRLQVRLTIAPGVRARLADTGELGFLVVQTLMRVYDRAAQGSEVTVAVRAEETRAVLEVVAASTADSDGPLEAAAALELRSAQLGVDVHMDRGHLSADLSARLIQTWTSFSSLSFPSVVGVMSGGPVGSARILAVDDERDTCEALAEMLTAWGHKVETAFDAHDALRKASEFRPDVVVSDLAMPETDGLGLLRTLRDEMPDCPVVLLTGHGTIDAAVAAIREGAYDFIVKPLDTARLKVTLDRALEKKETMREVQGLRRRLKQLGSSDFIGQSTSMRKVFELIEKVAPSKASVAISGESGTGKEVVARSIHNLSQRREKPFVAINCASIPATLIESEIFGHEKGAFTGADQRRPGVFELAHGGTLFLDELGEIPIELQAKLLRVLEEGRLRRLGGKVELEVDVRVLCATNRDLKKEIEAKRFREDLYFRLNVFQIHLPPLRERRDDVPMLVQHFVEKFRGDSAKRLTGVHPDAMETLKNHEWPGNIRELRNAVERAVILCDGELITREHLPPDMSSKGPERHTFRLPFGLSLDAVEREYILGSLQRNGNNKARTAEVLGVSEKTLYNKLNRYAAESRQKGEGNSLSGSSGPLLGNTSEIR